MLARILVVLLLLSIVVDFGGQADKVWYIYNEEYQLSCWIAQSDSVNNGKPRAICLINNQFYLPEIEQV